MMVFFAVTHEFPLLPLFPVASLTYQSAAKACIVHKNNAMNREENRVFLFLIAFSSKKLKRIYSKSDFTGFTNGVQFIYMKGKNKVFHNKTSMILTLE
jgi:hypothetical protein